ncbi:MAG: serine/threonine-protein kinase [Planctomycetaceae bacterium]
MPTETANDLCPACDRRVPGNAPGGLCPFCLLQTVLSDASIEPSGNADGIDSTICDNSNTSQPNGLSADFSESRIDDFPPVGDGVRYFGDYELLEEIASGGMGVVYRARQVRLNRIVALKMIRAGKFSSWTEIKRLRAEAEAAAQLDHPNIVPVFEVGEQDGLHYFTMAFVDGPTLSEKLSHGPLPVQEAAELIHRVAKAIAYAHDAGVIHRDIKPGNILIDKAGQPRVSDFGLAKQVTLESDLTTTGQILGTPSYMPPEQALGRLDEVNRTSDIYSLGAVLYATLSGRPPFQAASSVETLRQVVDQQPVAPRLLNPSVPRDLETICLKCLEKKRPRDILCS